MALLYDPFKLFNDTEEFFIVILRDENPFFLAISSLEVDLY
jgi:hypothetical protein